MTSSPSSVFFIFLLLTLLLTVSSDLEEDEKALRKFKDNIKYDSSKVNWDGKEKKICDWTGVTCQLDTVFYLRLPAISLKGSIPEGSLGKITSLRTLSLGSNMLSGPFPDDFADLLELRNVYLHNNKFSGVFPTSVTKWTKLLALNLSDNEFTGTIYTHIINLKRIKHLWLQNNRFTGKLPPEFPSSIVNFSVSNNNLSGPIPIHFRHFPLAAFSGNFDLCNKPLSNQCNTTIYPVEVSLPSNSTSSDNKKKTLSTVAIVAIAVVSALILLILLLCLGKMLDQAVKEKKEPGVASKAAKVGAESGSERRGEAGTSSSKDDDTGASKLS